MQPRSNRLWPLDTKASCLGICRRRKFFLQALETRTTLMTLTSPPTNRTHALNIQTVATRQDCAHRRCEGCQRFVDGGCKASAQFRYVLLGQPQIYVAATKAIESFGVKMPGPILVLRPSLSHTNTIFPVSGHFLVFQMTMTPSLLALPTPDPRASQACFTHWRGVVDSACDWRSFLLQE